MVCAIAVIEVSTRGTLRSCVWYILLTEKLLGWSYCLLDYDWTPLNWNPCWICVAVWIVAWCCLYWFVVLCVALGLCVWFYLSIVHDFVHVSIVSVKSGAHYDLLRFFLVCWKMCLHKERPIWELDRARCFSFFHEQTFLKTKIFAARFARGPLLIIYNTMLVLYMDLRQPNAPKKKNYSLPTTSLQTNDFTTPLKASLHHL